jgi:hypothetical protein
VIVILSGDGDVDSEFVQRCGALRGTYLSTVRLPEIINAKYAKTGDRKEHSSYHTFRDV